MTEQTNQPVRKIPIPLAIGVLVLAIAGGAALLWYWLGGPRGGDMVVFQEPEYERGDLAAAARRAMLAAQPSMRPSRSGWTVRAAGATMTINRRLPATTSATTASTRPRRAPTTTFSYAYQMNELGDPQTIRLNTFRWRVLNDSALAKQLELSSNQLKQLRALPNPMAMKLSAADEQTLRDLWEAYSAAPADRKTDAEKTLVSTFERIANQSRTPTRQAAIEIAAKIKSIVTAEQLARFDRPTTRPTSRP